MKTTFSMTPPVALGDILTTITLPLQQSAHRPPATPSRDTAPATRPTPVAPAPRPATPAPEPDYALFIAIDWADDHHDLGVYDPATPQRTHQRIDHDSAVLHAWLADLHQRFPDRRLAVALEQQHTGSLLNLLVEAPLLDL